MSWISTIARRYLFSKKSTHAINVISLIAVIGVATAAMAMVVVLSVFNGFQDLTAQLFSAFDPQIKVVPAKGKTAPADDPLLAQLRVLPQVEVVTECVEDNALAVWDNHQVMINLKGVDDNFDQLVSIKDILYGEGSFSLHAADLSFGIPGIRLAQQLGTGADWKGFLPIYAPIREGQPDITNPASAVVSDSLLSAGVLFYVRQSKYDSNTMIVPISFARTLLNQQGMLSSLEFKLKPDANLQKVKRQMRKIVGSKYNVLDRYEQQGDTFRIMQIEKLVAFFFLAFILVVACFNIVSSLSMLMIDKREDIRTLSCLGATEKQIASIFRCEGLLIALAGALLGIIIGVVLCLLQQHYGIVRLGGSDGTYILDAYPVSLRFYDVVAVFLASAAAAALAAWLPVRQLGKRLVDEKQ